MNSFFESEFHISKICLCVKVRKGFGERVHIDRPSHGLVIHLDGSKYYHFSDGSDMTVTEGDVFYLPKGSTYTVDDIRPGECIAVNFELTDSAVTFPHFRCNTAKSARHLPKFELLLQHWGMHTPASLNLCMGILYQLIFELQSDIKTGYLQSSDKRIAELASAYIADNLAGCELSVEAIAENAHMSPEYLRRIFGKVYGISPRKYIIMRRIEKAKELLRYGEFKIAEIATLCGFETPAYFCRRFKAETGCTPTEFAEQKWG